MLGLKCGGISILNPECRGRHWRRQWDGLHNNAMGSYQIHQIAQGLWFENCLFGLSSVNTACSSSPEHKPWFWVLGDHKYLPTETVLVSMFLPLAPLFLNYKTFFLCKKNIKTKQCGENRKGVNAKLVCWREEEKKTLLWPSDKMQTFWWPFNRKVPLWKNGPLISLMVVDQAIAL